MQAWRDTDSGIVAGFVPEFHLTRKIVDIENAGGLRPEHSVISRVNSGCLGREYRFAWIGKPLSDICIM